MLNVADSFSSVFRPVASFFGGIILFLLVFLVSLLIAFALYFFISLKQNPLHLDLERLKSVYIRQKYVNLFRWLLVDFLNRKNTYNEFKEYGFTFFVGRQGAGKTASMVRYLEEMKERYPNCKIVTNFGYYRSDYIMEDWRDILTMRNGTDGIIFAIDEIHSEYSSASWKDVPEDLLSEISQQRKQRVKIVATAQFFSRVAKPLREQASTVAVCSTLFCRLTRTKFYDALQYSLILDNPNVAKKKLKPLHRHSFVQSDAFRSCYDTYEKIKRMEKIRFIPRNERPQFN